MTLAWSLLAAAVAWWFAGSWLGRQLFLRAPRAAVILGVSRPAMLASTGLTLTTVTLVAWPGPVPLAAWVLEFLLAASVARCTRGRALVGLALVPRRRPAE